MDSDKELTKWLAIGKPIPKFTNKFLPTIPFLKNPLRENVWWLVYSVVGIGWNLVGVGRLVKKLDP